ncbi:MAG: type II toxin-antitoxin system VapC family toxin [Armatimonadetes bacterium]|nr:type II toxin-antitoxin system VapC family toxin [Armatimonadota bacterium]
MVYLLDTNVVSELGLREPNPGLITWVDQQAEPLLFLSVLTVGEIQQGIQRLPVSRRQRELRDWFRRQVILRFGGRILALDTPTMLLWGDMTAERVGAGRPMPAMDSLLAATALAHDLTLVTRNESDFDVPGLRVLNPWS